MNYKLKFHPKALKEFKSLQIREQEYFKEKLEERLEQPHIPASRLSGAVNIYKIKRTRPPLRLTYVVDDDALIVTALSVGRRDGSVYVEMLKRLQSFEGD